MNRIILLIILSWMMSAVAQDTSFLLISKIDIGKNYELPDGNKIHLMGFTEKLSAPITLPSPTIRVKEGDSVDIELWNMSQSAPHSIHLHGLDVNQENDGVPMLSWQLEHDEKGHYRFKAPHPGTYLYHCHVFSPVHVQAGMYGLFIVEAAEKNKTWDGGYSFVNEQSWLMSEIDTNWHTDSMMHHSYNKDHSNMYIINYQPQFFLTNGIVDDNIANNDVAVTQGHKTYLRLANVGYYANKVVFPNEVEVEVISSDGRSLPKKEISNEVWVFPGERFGLLLEAKDSSLLEAEITYHDLNSLEEKGRRYQTIRYDAKLSVNKKEIQTDISVYPNPVQDVVFINGDLNELQELQLIDIYGRVLMNVEGIISNQLDVSQFESGTYFLNFQFKDKQEQHKITIQ